MIVNIISISKEIENKLKLNTFIPLIVIKIIISFSNLYNYNTINTLLGDSRITIKLKAAKGQTVISN